MTAINILTNELVHLRGEIKNPKPAARGKTLTRLITIFEQQEENVIIALSKASASANWIDLFTVLHEAIQIQVENLSASNTQTNLNKNNLHASALQKCINLANRNELNIQYETILSAAFECFSEPRFAEHFALCYLQIVSQNVLQCKKGNLATIKASEWKDFIDHCLLYYASNNKLPKLNLLECINWSIQNGLKYTHIASDLHSLLREESKLISIVNSELMPRARIHVNKIVLELSKNLASTYHDSVNCFNENVLSSVIASYDFKVDVELKTTLFKLFHVALVAHFPNGSNPNENSINANLSEERRKIWHQHVRNIYHIVQKEIAGQNREMYDKKPTICRVFVQMAARLCATLFWDPIIWENQTSDEQQHKRRRRSSKLERMMELVQVENGTFCWRWMTILSALLCRYPILLSAENYQPLLLLLKTFQEKAKNPIEIKTLTDICAVLLSKETEMLSRSTSCSEDVCNEHWVSMSQMAYRNSAANSNTGRDNIKLLRLLIAYNKFESLAFIVTVVKAALSFAITRCDETFNLLITIFKHVNIERLDDGKELKHATIRWIIPKLDLADHISLGRELCEVDDKLKGELAALCVLSKLEQIKQWPTNEASEANGINDEFMLFIDELEKNLQYRTMSKLIVLNSCNPIKQKSLTPISSVVHSHLLQPIIVDSAYEELGKTLNQINCNSDELQLSQHVDYNLTEVVTSLTMCMSILHHLLYFEAMDAGRANNSFLNKQIQLKINQMNMVIRASINISQTETEIKDTAETVLRIFNNNFSPIVNNLLSANQQNEPLIKWCIKQLDEVQLCDTPLDSTVIMDETKLSIERQVQLKCLLVLAHLAASNNEDSITAFDYISNYTFNNECQLDTFIFLTVLKVILRQSPTDERADWAVDEIKTCLSRHHREPDNRQKIVDLLPSLFKYAGPYFDVMDNVSEIITSFLKLARRETCSVPLVVRLIKNIKYLAQECCNNLENTQEPFKFLKTFLHSDVFDIRIATIESFSFIFDKHWVCKNHSSLNQTAISTKEFYLNVFDALEIEQLVSDIDDLNIQDQDKSTRIQLYSSCIAKCFTLRNRCLFYFTNFARKIKLKTETVLSILEMSICATELSSKLVDATSDAIPFLIYKWIDNSCHITEFPWYLSKQQNIDEFILMNKNLIAATVLKYRPEFIGNFLKMLNETSLLDLLNPENPEIVWKCLAYVLPMNISLSELPPNFKKNSSRMLKILMEAIPDVSTYFVSHGMEIVMELLLSTWDNEKLNDMFGITVDYVTEEYSFSCDIFNKSLNYMADKYYNGSNVILQQCLNQPYCILNTLNSFKYQIQFATIEEQKLVYLFKLCVLIDKMIPFFLDSGMLTNVQQFFISDLVYFFCNSITNESYTDELKNATLVYFLQFFKHILPKCSTIFHPYLNVIVSAVIPHIKSNQNSSLAIVALELLDFLIDTQYSSLKQSIALLDNFPAQPIFEKFRDKHLHAKYDGKTFSLTEEIEYFLKVEKRKVEGLLALKDHLSSKKSQLRDIYQQNNEMIAFSEDCEKSIIHRLIYSLLQTVQGSDIERSHVAAQCLGELGPNDLGTMVLRTDVNRHIYKWTTKWDTIMIHLHEAAIERLNNLLTHSDTRVLQVVTPAIHNLIGKKYANSPELLSRFPLLTDLQRSNIPRRLEGPLTKSLNLKQFVESDDIITHSKWIKQIVIHLFEYIGNDYLGAVSALQTRFAEDMLPFLIQAILTKQEKVLYKQLGDLIQHFFRGHFIGKSTANNNITQQINNITQQMRVSQNTNDTIPIFLNKISIKSMLNVVECVRLHNFYSIEDLNIPLPYAHIAEAAYYCEAYVTAMLYGEMACLEDNRNATTMDGNLQEIMKHAYIASGEMDGASAFLNPIEARRQYLQAHKTWNQIFLELDATVYKSPEQQDQYSSYLAQSGLHYLANRLSQTSGTQNYECAWRLGDWSILDEDGPRPTSNISPAVEFQKYHYFALKFLNTKNANGTKTAVRCARETLIKFFKQSSFECSNNLYKSLLSLHLLQQIDEFCDIQFSSEATVVDPEFIINKWKLQNEMPCSDFSYREPILAQRITILQSAGIRAKRRLERVLNMKDGIHEMLLNLVTECRQENHLNLATRHLAVLSNLTNSSSMKLKIKIEDAKLNWSRGDERLAKMLVENVANERVVLLSIIEAQRLYGEYLAESRSENVKVVIKNYLHQSIKTLEKWGNNLKVTESTSARQIPQHLYNAFAAKHMYLAYKSIAKYADREYQQICDYKNSDNFAKKIKAMEFNSKQYVEMCKKKSLSNDEIKTSFLLEKSSTVDRTDIENTKQECAEHLKTALTCYLKTILLERDNDNSVALFRIFSLWFSNKSDATVLECLQNSLDQVASYKFIPMMPQIVTRLSNDNEQFSQQIERIVSRCAIEHPYHTLHQILALTNAYKDDLSSTPLIIPPRIAGAKMLLQKLHKHSEIHSILVQMEKMCNALIQLANVPSSNSKLLSSKEPLLTITNLNLVHCPTIKIKVSVCGDYSALMTTIVRWKNTVGYVGGVNAPKKLECLCSDGRWYSQLLKGKDDLRQDAVMQQVFNIMNDMLKNSKKTKMDRLKVRTYIVMALSQRSGILEWCENTMPLNEYLVGNNNTGAHIRFRPKDLKPLDARKAVQNVNKKLKEERYENFKRVCEKIQPVFHYFFFEKFQNPGDWFEKRLAYAHSLATNSMIGYILGIGDRHVSNILIDQSTAELVHIDFGIAFDQGKCLPTPETIPFRLTRDLVSALGCTGVEGVFRRSCEKTMEVLRQNKATIITILEVLLHDPLYSWCLADKKAHRAQSNNDLQTADAADSNTMAVRALMRLQEKLDGKHSSRMEPASVESHVEVLIKEAISIYNQSQLFAGWQAYL